MSALKNISEPTARANLVGESAECWLDSGDGNIPVPKHPVNRGEPLR